MEEVGLEYIPYKTKGYEGTVMSIAATIFWLLMPIPMCMHSRPLCACTLDFLTDVIMLIPMCMHSRPYVRAHSTICACTLDPVCMHTRLFNTSFILWFLLQTLFLNNVINISSNLNSSLEIV